ncbi:MAG: peptidase [Actinomycetia bacterium]|nr:peptidase [Actinomycetes bacterium]
MRRTLSLVTALAVAALGSVAAAPAHADQGYTTTYESIPGDGSTPIRAFVVKPDGNGPFPLLVMPSSWSLLDGEYLGAAVKLASTSGYEVISYTSRGFWDSGGQIEVAGPKDVGDASALITWAIAHRHADPSKVGMAGVSYGAGIALLTAAKDKRVRAVAAMSGWADLIASLYPNRTVSEQAAGGLLLLGNVTGRPSPDLIKVQNAYLSDDIAKVLPLAATRGAATYLSRLNAAHPAVMIGNQWEDGIFPPSQVTDFFTRLTGPKHLMLQPGDHGTADLLGAVGLPNDTWAAATRWFDHYLRGSANGVDREDPITVKAANGGGWLSFPSLSAMGPHLLRYGISAQRISAGVPTVADSGVVEVTGASQQAGISWKIKLSDVDRRNALVWTGPVLPVATSVGGFPLLHTTVTPSAPNTSLFAYLYDVGPDGVGSLITYKPYTLRGALPGRALPIDLRLEPIRWNVAAGHRFALVIDTMDVRYRSMSRTGTTLTFTSPTTLTLPTS